MRMIAVLTGIGEIRAEHLGFKDRLKQLGEGE